MAYAAQASSILDLSTSVLHMSATSATSRQAKAGDGKTKRAPAQGRLELVPSSPLARTSSILFAPLSAPSSTPLSLSSASPPLNLVNTISVPVSAANVEVSICTGASAAAKSDMASVEQYVWSVCWFLMGLLFLCTT